MCQQNSSIKKEDVLKMASFFYSMLALLTNYANSMPDDEKTEETVKPTQEQELKNVTEETPPQSNITVTPVKNCSFRDLKHIERTIKNVQIYPATTRVEINDRAVKKLFSLSHKDYNELRNGTPFSIVETTHHPKYGEISTPYSFISPFSDPLNEFDRAVLSVCTSEYLAGNQYTTVNIIFRALIGKVGQVSIRPRKHQKAAILHSIDKLMSTVVSFDTSESFKLLNYKSCLKSVKSAILPCCHVEATINGQTADVIFFDRLSPLFITANIKNQIVRFPSDLLDVPKQNNTSRLIAVKLYVLRRICEITSHKLSPTLTLDDIFSKCRIASLANQIKSDARNAILQLFQHLKLQHFISDFSLRKKERGNGFYGFSFSY